MPPRQASPPFVADERVFCFHMDLLYEARILDVGQDPDNNQAWRYRIHYKGWKATWDDWVPQDRVRKFNEENRKLATDLRNQFRQHMADRNAAKSKKSGGASGIGRASASASGGPTGGSSGTPGPPPGSGAFGRDHHDRHRGGSELASARVSEERIGGSSTAHARGRQRQRDYELESEDAFHNRPSIRLPLPDNIKAVLVDDWENITKNKQLVPLPHKYSVNDILDDYLAFEGPHRAQASASLDTLLEVSAGMREYFDRCLGRVLLYLFERPQYIDIRELYVPPTDKYKSASDVYGVEHLCRLLAKMPELIPQTNMDQQSVNRLRDEMLKMASWLSNNLPHYVASEYATPPESYAADIKS